jgi:phenylalanyl-tRNA synthetase beta chain
MMTNSITNAAYFTEEERQPMVKMMNNLSAELNILRPSLLETSLEVVARNLNHKNSNLKLLNLVKDILPADPASIMKWSRCYGNKWRTTDQSWKGNVTDFFYTKGHFISFELLE